MKEGTDPIELFLSWYQLELDLSEAEIPSACCLSTNGLDGFPNARFVSLKTVNQDGFIITGSIDSRKGMELAASDKTSLTFWWTSMQRQVRIQGRAERIPDELADRYFSERDRASQLVSTISEQGKENKEPEKLLKIFETALNKDPQNPIARPAHWGGYLIKPIRIEFMQFHINRFHERWMFEKGDHGWVMKSLQP
ncbi:MAG: pyridoxine/pyridoxamine 5'-phosphate oxidase [Flavisolibacter sp.]